MPKAGPPKGTKNLSPRSSLPTDLSSGWHGWDFQALTQTAIRLIYKSEIMITIASLNPNIAIPVFAQVLAPNFTTSKEKISKVDTD